MACVQRDPLAREVASHVPEFWHAAKLSFREYRSVMTDQVGSYDAGSAYSDAALEHPFQAYLDVAVGFHCEVVDLLHHRLGATSVEGVGRDVAADGFGVLGDRVLLPGRCVAGCASEF